ncbi:MAG: NAD(P)/FAD-dependent oxidoreductase [Leptospirales bacterium]|nr:NAD(P)/FAD-dependent oxidoreductase [Leptospirales bacterium]
MNRDFDALVIGAGPAGVSAAIWLQLLGLRPLLIERSKRVGGLLYQFDQPNLWMPGLPAQSGPQYAAALAEHLQLVGAELRLQSELVAVERNADGFHCQVQNATGSALERIQARRLVMASGVRSRDGGLQAGPGVVIGPGQALDQAPVAGLRVALLGGGDNAAEYYTILNKKHPALIHVYARTLRARPALAERIAEGDLFAGAYSVDLSTLQIQRDGQRRNYDLIAALYGWQAVLPSALRAELGDALDERGFVRTDASRQTPAAGIYCVGEAAQAVHPCVVTALADGVVAAKAIEAELRGARSTPE